MYGRNALTNNTVLPTRVSADGSPIFKAGGATIDWNTVVAVTGTSTATLADGSTIAGPAKYLRYGQVLTKITASGKFGPYDPNVVDGRQTLTRGEAFILDRTLLQYDTGNAGNSVPNDQTGSLIEGGRVFPDRVLQTGTNTATVAAGPTLANLLTAFPAIQLVKD